MLPRQPTELSRSMWSSAMTPFSMSATRVSRMSTLMTRVFLDMEHRMDVSITAGAPPPRKDLGWVARGADYWQICETPGESLQSFGHSSQRMQMAICEYFRTAACVCGQACAHV